MSTLPSSGETGREAMAESGLVMAGTHLGVAEGDMMADGGTVYDDIVCDHNYWYLLQGVR